MRVTNRLALLAAGCVLALAPPAWAEDEAEPGSVPETGAYDDYDELYFEESEQDDGDGDPFERVNRGIFKFNDGLDRWVLEPVSEAFDFVVPDPIQRAVRRAFDNLRFPVIFFNDLFQLKPVPAGKALLRFAFNTTLGLGGLLDPAAPCGLPAQNEDFGQTLGFWGVPAGPYLMIPLFGPTTVRDGAGVIVDSAFRAIGFFIPFWASASMQVVDTVNRRALIRDAVQAERRAALDWYAAVRSAYTQYRENLVQDRQRSAELGSDLYPGIDGDENP